MPNSSSTPPDAPDALPNGQRGESGSPTPTSPTPSPKRPGTIVRVSYGATVNIENYENIRFDLTADIEPGERWQDVLERLRGIVDRHKAKIKKEGY